MVRKVVKKYTKKVKIDKASGSKHESGHSETITHSNVNNSDKKKVKIPKAHKKAVKEDAKSKKSKPSKIIKEKSEETKKKEDRALKIKTKRKSTSGWLAHVRKVQKQKNIKEWKVALKEAAKTWKK